MDQGTMLAHFDKPISHIAHCVVLIDNVVIEYNDGLSQEYRQGIYCFETKVAAEKFVNLCNEMFVISTGVAYHFENETLRPKRNRKETKS